MKSSLVVFFFSVSCDLSDSTIIIILHADVYPYTCTMTESYRYPVQYTQLNISTCFTVCIHYIIDYKYYIIINDYIYIYV